MNVYDGREGHRRLLGQAQLPWDHGPILILRDTGEQFALHPIRCLDEAGLVVETAVLLSPGQRPDLLPGWRPAATTPHLSR
ncbi:hypothetical protein [Roseococcus pinisoli]|uniref:Uncharacterized protein n=1 Tax=Roseococcus pinisoli TaxID=2835040 RepID=A0ABS5QD37_9PROT|nr:hypothetical protein [Roseococcus pinisoli]MBS7811434.1 hypothetical protein [Roseococcus pinisoli]